jgi:DNA primase
MNNATEQIKAQIDIVEYINQFVQLKKAGRHYVGFCPFHQNTRTPSFTVFPDSQSFHCFGCKASGTVFDFLMRREGLEFRDALETLARQAGIELEPRTEATVQQDQLRTRLLDINQATAIFFRHLLIKSPRGEKARAYVAQRGIDDATSEAFQLGYAPEDWSLLISFLTDKRGFDVAEIEQAGLAIHREQGGYFDRFRDRLMFPIRNPKGEIIAFGGRAFGDAQPKYMNSPQTVLYDKSSVLYGLDLARETIRAQEAVVIVEGYVDVMMAHQYGFTNVVAPLGTALTADHVALLKKSAKIVYLALDADAAGVRATLKGVETLRENLAANDVLRPTPEGYIRWERELQTEIRVIDLPDGQDPDQVIQANPQQWEALVRAARPVMDFYLQALTTDLDLRAGKGKVAAINRLAPLLSQIASPVEQSHYIQKVASLIGVHEHDVRQSLPNRPGQVVAAPANESSKGKSKGKDGQRSGNPPWKRAEAPSSGPRLSMTLPTHNEQEQAAYLLSWLIRYPQVRTAVVEKLRNDLLQYPLIAELIEGEPLELFEHPAHRAIWQAWVNQPEETDPIEWATHLSAPLAEMTHQLFALHVPEMHAYRYINDALECATILQRNLALRWKSRVDNQIASEDETLLALAIDRLVQIKAYLNVLSIPKRSSTFSDLRTTLRTV